MLNTFVSRHDDAVLYRRPPSDRKSSSSSAVELAREAAKAEKRAAKRKENRRVQVAEGEFSARSDHPLRQPRQRR
jgi:hypothetical protein